METFIAYAFGIFVTGTYIYMSFISKSGQNSRYFYRLVFASKCIIFGILIDSIEVFNKPFGYFIILSTLPFIYLIYYEIFRRLLLKWIGRYPYAPYWDKIGDKVNWPGYPKDRKVTKSDYLFGYLMFFVPMLSMLIIIVRFNK